MPNKSTKTHDNFNFLWDGPIMSPVYNRNIELIFRINFIGRSNQTITEDLSKETVSFLWDVSVILNHAEAQALFLTRHQQRLRQKFLQVRKNYPARQALSKGDLQDSCDVLVYLTSVLTGGYRSLTLTFILVWHVDCVWVERLCRYGFEN